MSSEHTPGQSGFRARFIEEIRSYAAISIYLWVCFGALWAYETAILRGDNLQYLPVGTAAIKALIFGKFILLGKAAIKAGGRIEPKVLVYRIIWRSVAMLLLLLVFTTLEELVLGVLHGHALAATIEDLTARPLLEKVAPSLVMLLILIPMISLDEIDRALGQGTIKRTLFSRSGGTR
ncbi:MAG: hypothetical protein V2J12_02930 [Gammaproteobacteria bacterium]|jgi:hypothetical protein|nr:hypothetical protein [Gammaproteobacteria bacterium]